MIFFSKKLQLCLMMILFQSVVGCLWAIDAVPAFPGAEGFGRYTTGGRGGTVYHVTTLEDSTTPTKGMLRYALNQKGARIIVFDVAGTIFLKGELKISRGDLTIAGQTAPGDGICIADYPVVLAANNVIIRYLRFRVGNRHVAEHEGDGLGGMDKDNIIIDHCSISWSVDECCSVYGGKNITVQWSLIAQSMVNCGHSKGAHGYGGNWGGSGCTYAHNLLMHHTSRTPRLGPRPGTQLDERLDMRNNVIYNWGGLGCYGGEGMNVNIVNNYYKPGPGTQKRSTAIQKRIAAPGIRTTSYCAITQWNPDGSPADGNSWAPMWHVWGDYYVDGNVNSNYSSVTTDNWTNGIYNQIDNSANDNTFTSVTRDTMRVDTPLSFPYTTTWSAEDAYQRVLDYAGCLSVRSREEEEKRVEVSRDRLDSILVSDVRKGVATFTGSGLDKGFINSQEDVLGKGVAAWPILSATSTELNRASIDSDADGIPDYYETLYWGHATNTSANDQCAIEGYTQYTNMDYYLDRLVQDNITRYINAEQQSGYVGNAIALGNESELYDWNVAMSIEQNTVSTYKADDTYYNLLGQPVQYPVRGQMYVRGGRKVFVK